MTDLQANDRAKLRTVMLDRFDLGELIDLAFDLGIDYQSLGHSTTPEFCRELIAYCERTNRVSCLVMEALARRDDEYLAHLYAQLPSCKPRLKVEIILRGPKVQDEKKFLEGLAALLEIPVEDVGLLDEMAGSVHLLVSLPEQAVERLLTLDVDGLVIGEDEVIGVSVFEALEPERQALWRKHAVCLGLIKQGVEVWNEWRQGQPNVIPELRGVDLSGANLSMADFGKANLSGANLSGANLSMANLRKANLRKANLSGANLSGANLRKANLSEADLSEADLSEADLSGANLRKADLRKADLFRADLLGANLRKAYLSQANLSEGGSRRGGPLRGEPQTGEPQVRGLQRGEPQTGEPQQGEPQEGGLQTDEEEYKITMQE